MKDNLMTSDFFQFRHLNMFTHCLMLFIYRRTTLSGGPLFTMLHMKEYLKKRLKNKTLVKSSSHRQYKYCFIMRLTLSPQPDFYI
jgi:hypothetical protein